MSTLRFEANEYYRYGKLWLLDDLALRRTHASDPRSFNDLQEHTFRRGPTLSFEDFCEIEFPRGRKFPPEMLPEIYQRYLTGWAKPPHPQFKWLRDYVKKEAAKNYRVICLARPKIQPPDDENMWDRYGGAHSGVRLRFASQFWEEKGGWMSSKICYRRRMPELGFHPKIEETDRDVRRTLFSKSVVWRREHEQRILIDTDKTTCSSIAETPCYHVEVTERDILAVDFGARLGSFSRDRYIYQIRKIFPHLRFYQASFRREEYGMDYNELLFANATVCTV